MRTSVPTCETVISLRGRISGAGGLDVRAHLPQQVEYAAGAGHHDVGHVRERVLLVGRRADQEAWVAVRAQLLDRLERLDVTEVVTAEGHGLGTELLDQPTHGGTLVHPVG